MAKITDEERRRFLQALLLGGASLSGLGALLPLAGCTSLASIRRNPAGGSGPLKSDRIAIIGAGAAGISAAHYLRQAGYFNITVFEERDRIGGKCNTVQIDAFPYDMGAVFTTSSYIEVSKLAEEFGARFEPLQGTDAGVIIKKEDGVFNTMNTLDRAELGVAAAAYLAEITKYGPLYQPGFQGLNPDVMVSFKQWMQAHSLTPETLASFFGFTFTPFGYGYADEVPAAYALKYYENKLVSSLLIPSQLKMVSSGYQNLWERVARDMDVRLNTPVLKITRNGAWDGSNPWIAIQPQNSREEIFQHLILTCPMEVTAKTLDCSAAEQEMFSHTKNYFYYSFAIETPSHFPSTGFLPVNYNRWRAKHPLCWFKRWAAQDITIFYALSNTEDDVNTVLATIFEDSKRYNWNLGKVRDAKRWRYFPHFSSTDLQRNIYERLEEWQGTHGIYLAGEIMNFSTVELVTRYSKDLVSRFF